jgi:hypothetical protein
VETVGCIPRWSEYTLSISLEVSFVPTSLLKLRKISQLKNVAILMDSALQAISCSLEHVVRDLRESLQNTNSTIVLYKGMNEQTPLQRKEVTVANSK